MDGLMAMAKIWFSRPLQSSLCIGSGNFQLNMCLCIFIFEALIQKRHSLFIFLYLGTFLLRNQYIITNSILNCHCLSVPCFDFQSSSIGVLLITELGSSCAAEFTVSFAPVTTAKSVSQTKRKYINKCVIMKGKPLLQVIKTTPKHINQAYNK